MRYCDIDPRDIDPETNRPYSNYSSPCLDTSEHDAEMNCGDLTELQGIEDELVMIVKAIETGEGWAAHRDRYKALGARLEALGYME